MGRNLQVHQDSFLHGHDNQFACSFAFYRLLSMPLQEKGRRFNSCASVLERAPGPNGTCGCYDDSHGQTAAGTATTIYLLTWQCLKRLSVANKKSSKLFVPKPTGMLHVKLNVIHPVVAQPVLLQTACAQQSS